MVATLSKPGEIYSGVLYYVVGDKHITNLLVSLASLRLHYSGPVAILCDDVSSGLIEQMARDRRLAGDQLRVCTLSWPKVSKRNNGYANKTLLFDRTPFNSTLFVDADTIFAAPPQFATDERVCLTQFAHWTTKNKGTIRKRIASWNSHTPELCAHQLNATTAYPAINTGVIAWTRGDAATHFSKTWRATTLKNVSFICDEIAAQLIFPHCHCAVWDDRFNWSALHSRRPVAEACILHFHGRKNIKHWAGRKVWLRYYRWVLANNYGNVRTWAPGNFKELAKYLRDPKIYDGPDKDWYTDPTQLLSNLPHDSGLNAGEYYPL